jgi:hypothetical protein
MEDFERNLKGNLYRIWNFVKALDAEPAIPGRGSAPRVSVPLALSFLSKKCFVRNRRDRMDSRVVSPRELPRDFAAVSICAEY